jgi:hypothetical protein
VTDRVIRDELLTSERYWSVSIEAQRLFVHLILCADDLGRFSGKNYTIRTSCFPGQAVPSEKVEKLLTELQDTDLVRVYQHEGERFIFIPRFRQRLRYFHSRYPSPPKEINDIPEEKSVQRQTTVGPKPDSSQRKRREVKRSEEKKSIERGTRLPPDWSPNDLLYVWASNARPDLDIASVVAKFRDYWTAKPGRGGTKLDWDATFRNWVRDEKPGRQTGQKIKVDL